MFFVPISRKVAKERGLKHYFTGEPCSMGNICIRRTSSYNCQCIDHLLAIQTKRSTPENRKKEVEYTKQWTKNNPDKVKVFRKGYSEKHSKTIVQNASKWGKNNPDKVKNKARIWRSKNKPLIKSHDIKRRCLKLNATIIRDELTNFVIEEAYVLSKDREKLFNFKWHLDHMIPLINDNVCGLHIWNNFQVIPQCVNNSKSNKLIYTNPHEWLYDIPKFFKVVHQQELVA